MQKLRVAVAGLRFGAAFVPIYRHHPEVAYVGLIDPDAARLDETGDRYGIERRHAGLYDALRTGDYDAVHLVTPIPVHAEQTLAVLEAGLHCACAVPMAVSIKDLHAIVETQRRGARNYMMMETAVYTREFLMAREMLRRGELGRVQFLRGAHYQDMQNWPPYWRGLPPMWYATHAVAPCLALAGTHARAVHGFGSGIMTPELQEAYGNPFPIETAIFQLAESHAAMEVTRSHFQTARAYQESFHVYGDRRGFEWAQLEGEAPVVHELVPAGKSRGGKVWVTRTEAPDRADLLPEAIARFTRRGKYDDTNPQQTFETGGGHHGAHPHLVHEFVRSIVEQRAPAIDAITAARWTAAGLCAHASAMQGGARVEIPSFD